MSERAPRHHRRPAPRRRLPGDGRRLSGVLLETGDPNALYSTRARRRMVAYLKLRLLELRAEHLARAADAIERRLPVSELLSGP